MIRIPCLITLFLLAGLVLGACDSSDDDDQKLDGIWERLQSDDPEEPEDILYLHLNGKAGTVYDFRGDAMDEGPDCYLVSTFNLEHVDDDRYRLSAPELEGMVLEVTVRLENDRLTIGSVLLGSISYRRATKSLSDFTPVCEDDEVGFGVNKTGRTI